MEWIGVIITFLSLVLQIYGSLFQGNHINHGLSHIKGILKKSLSVLDDTFNKMLQPRVWLN